MIPDEVKVYLKDFINKYWKITILITASVLVGYCSLLWLPKDNVIEQEAEALIKDETGISVDLTS